ncbi:MAG: hypothetical protein ABSB49_00495 [Polyangia bacterium]|jgi:hypothetical protein
MCFWRRLRGDKHGSSAAARCLAVAVVVAMCAGQLAVMAHEITVVHFRCPEHGELTHLLAPPAGAALPATSALARLAVQASGTRSAEAHEHCGLAFTVEGRPSSPAHGTVIDLAPPRPVLATGAPARAQGRVFVLASAPKTSPPAA